MNYRIGTGYDIHALVPGRPLILGGIEIPFEKGFKAHSDGDALLHAIADALLGACALGDIGKHFPDTDPAFKDADSKELLGQVNKLILEKGYKPYNVDANVIAQKPKLTPYIDAMREKIAGVLDIPIDNVSVKARTAEGMDAVGEGKAIAVQASVLVTEKTCRS
ncbi:MAG: 2-C-methyl-D-erythritol 2,4-cyclodiphosphate synthase [Pseudomonadota bacterium]